MLVLPEKNRNKLKTICGRNLKKVFQSAFFDLATLVKYRNYDFFVLLSDIEIFLYEFCQY